MKSAPGWFFLAAALVVAGIARADPFGAMPGLWKTTYGVAPGDGGTPPPPRWHCVDEAADPWSAYAQLPVARPACKPAQYQRNFSSLQWKVACGAAPGEGSLVFDSPKHYSGSISAGGVTLRVQGERVAACTSPSD